MINMYELVLIDIYAIDTINCFLQCRARALHGLAHNTRQSWSRSNGVYRTNSVCKSFIRGNTSFLGRFIEVFSFIDAILTPQSCCFNHRWFSSWALINFLKSFGKACKKLIERAREGEKERWQKERRRRHGWKFWLIWLKVQLTADIMRLPMCCFCHLIIIAIGIM